ncbi:YLP motif-containing protein 1 [Cyphomyrmex costatus]|uniref:YLP motif-containing protein 1 n=1 Tax=Cyphomyrmex costatus TaxID=456900 RepID=A0A195C8V6_9HYME|nr:YLP motif-containing protein 1 [Cyphomyrmex costatus]
MQNWNQWPLSTGVTAPLSQPPIGYVTPATGADTTTMMQNYMQYYNQPTPTGYTPEQWAMAQQQGWAQWQQWNQQYQQWQTQYGDKYQEMKHVPVQNMNLPGQMQVTSSVPPPPLPKEDTRPPLPPTTNTYQFTNMPPPHQNNLPLFPAKESADKITSQANITNPPLPTSQPPLPPEINRENITAEKSSSNVISDSKSAKKLISEEELTEAEKTFDVQFKQWEQQFNTWKQQNANHPDKTQYKQYEAKWTSWREKLLERREQMRKKREQQKQAAAKAEVEKNKNVSGDDKILNILSNTENQGLINNLLGIGKTLGLTGKQNISASLVPPPPPPPMPETTSSSNQPVTQRIHKLPSQLNMIGPAVPNWSNSQQWGNQQYNPRIEAPTYGLGISTMPPMLSMSDIGPSQISSNFAQPQLNMPNNVIPNFSQPPPNFSNNDRTQLPNVKAPGLANTNDCPPFGSADSSSMDKRFMHPNDRLSHSFDGQPNFKRGDHERFGRDNINPNLHEQEFRPSTDNFDEAEAQHFRRGEKNYNDFGNNQLNSQNNFNSGNDRFGPTKDHFASGNNRFSENNRFGSMGGDRPGNDRIGMDKDHRGPGNDRFPDNERFGSDRFAPGGEQFVSGTNRFFSGNDRFGSNNENFRPNDRFDRGNFDSNDSSDNRRDSFGTNTRSFIRNSSFNPSNELSPELKKLMEKRKAAGDVFRPSFIDSDKSTGIGSLSESFKKIAGHSLFKSSFDFQKNSANRSEAASSGLSSFQSHSSDLGQISTSLYGSRSHFFSHEPPFKGRPDSFAKHNPIDYNERGKNMEIKSHPNQFQLTNTEPQDVKRSENIETIDVESSLQTDNVTDAKDMEATQVNEADNSIEQNNIVSSDNLKDDNGEKNKIINDDNSLQQDNKKQDNKIQSNIESTNNSNNDVKKPESLPFMGENDVPPVDLNIEPPPELPNLCPISTDSNQNIPSNLNKDFNRKRPADNQFDLRFNNSFGSKRMEFNSCMPFTPRGPPMFSPGCSRAFLTDPSSPFLSQGSMGPRGPKDGQFGLNVLSENRFSPRRSNDEQCGDQDCNDELSEPNSEKFNPRGSVDELFNQFGPRALINMKFGPRGPMDRQIGSRGIDLPFSLRNPSPFGPRGNNMQFSSRRVNDRLDSRTTSERPFGLRGPNDGSFGPRGPNEGSFGPRGPSNTFFGTRCSSDSQSSFMGSNKFGKANEASFDKRPFDNSGSFNFSDEKAIDFQTSNEDLTSPRGSNESVPLGSCDSNDAVLQHNPRNESRFESRDCNSGSFGSSDFKAKDPMNDSTNSNFPPPSDSLLNRGDNLHRNSYIRKEQFEDNIFVKKARYESPKPTDEFNRNCPDRNIEMQKENNSEYIGHIPDLNKKETVSCPGYGPSDWKDKFGKVQRPGAEHNIDKNISSTFDEKSRSERTMIEPKVGDCKTQYSESTTTSEFQSKYAPNLLMRRPKNDEEFCVQKQFNYNHGEDKKIVESLHFTPTKIIDYGHMSRASIMDQQLSSVQSFDYGHGNLKPDLQQHHYPKTDFRNWVEDEQNLQEYDDKMNYYENTKGKYAGKTRNYKNTMNFDVCKLVDYNNRKEHDWQSNNDKKIDEEKKENVDYKERGHNSESEFRSFERIDNDQSDQYQSDKNVYKERIQEIRDSSRKEINKDNDKDDNRLKGNVNWQENANKNVVDTKLQETSLPPDTKKNVAESTTKTLELAKMPNFTMVDDLLCPPGRQNRPPKIAIILRGPPGSGKSFVAKLIKDKEVEQGGSAPRILSLDDYFLVEKEIEIKDDNGKKVIVKEMVYEYEEAMEQSYVTSLIKAFKKNITDGFFNFIILDCINEKISDYEEMWSFGKTKGFKVYVCEMEMDLQICLKRNVHNRTEDEINRIIDYFEPTPSYHQKLDVNSMLQEQAIEEVDMEDSQQTHEKSATQTEDSQDSQEDIQDAIGVSKWERMEAEDKLDRLDGLAKKKNETKPQTMEDFLQVPDYYNMEDTSGKKRVRWADLEERKEQEKMRAVGFVVGHTNWDRMMDPTKGGSALTRTKYI